MTQIHCNVSREISSIFPPEDIIVAKRSLLLTSMRLLPHGPVICEEGARIRAHLTNLTSLRSWNMTAQEIAQSWLERFREAYDN